MRRLTPPLVLALATLACVTSPQPPTGPPPPPETRFKDVRQLTFGGENAEAYWSFDDSALTLQSTHGGAGCDRIYRLPLGPDGAPGPMLPVSSGDGVTTCSFFLPGDQELIYASTHLGGRACPPKPDMREGYVWALHADYDIFRANADGTNVRRLTTTPGYDAEGTVCPKDGRIVFTSVRDGDLDLYVMDADGGNVKRLTDTPGYDGGAVWSPDCTKIAWRASRAADAKALEDDRALLARGLVRPTKLELQVMDVDGGERRQLTYLGAASFGPAFFPDGKRLIFSSNFEGGPRGREFDLWAVDLDGGRLERITTAPGFDGFPLFSNDGTRLVFASNRATPPGSHDTNVFTATWDFTAPPAVLRETAADRTLADARWLADPAREGRGLGTAGLDAAGAYVESRFRALGLAPAIESGYRQPFEVTTGLTRSESSELAIDGVVSDTRTWIPAGFSGPGKIEGVAVAAGYGIVAEKQQHDDYRGLDVRGRVVVVRRFVPGTFEGDSERVHGDLRRKAFVAREHGAIGLIVVDFPEKPANSAPDWAPPPDASLPALRPDGPGDAGLPVALVSRAAAGPLLKTFDAPDVRITVRLDTGLVGIRRPVFNVVGRLAASRANAPVLVVGAHYDHLGHGGHGSLAPDSSDVHAGADDNASGVATLLEVARTLAAQPERPFETWFVAFSGEEAGVLGSTHFTRTPPPGLSLPNVRAMLNLDMVGRLRRNTLSVLGTASASEWPGLVTMSCREHRVECTMGGDGYGPSDHMPFYAAGVPVLHFFTGAHGQYHKPSDRPETLNGAGMGVVAEVVSSVANAVGSRTEPLQLARVAAPAPMGDRRSFNASLGTIPDYAGPSDGARGVLLAGVRPGGAAELGGLRRGDLLVRLGRTDIGSVQDLMFALNAAHPGETVQAEVVRNGERIRFSVTYQEGRGR